MKFSIGKFFAWILVGLLLIGLLGFGITDVLVGRSNSNLATVGESKITSQDFVRVFQQDLSYYSEQIGKDISIEEAKSLGIPQISLGKLINSELISQKLKQFGISRGDKAVSEVILKDKAFQDLSGKFSKDIYQSALNRAGIELEEYENSIRDELSSSILQNLTASSIISNNTMSELLAKFILEKRSGYIVNMDLSDTIDQYFFSESVLREYFNDNEESFRVPDTSIISYATISAEDFVEKISLSEDEIIQFYKTNVEKISRDAQFDLDRIIYESNALAVDALTRITIGQSTFKEEGAILGLAEKDLNLGTLYKNEIASVARSQIQESREGDIIGPIKIPLGYAVYRVNTVQPEFKPTLEELRNEITRALSLQKGQESLDSIYDQINEEIAAGANFLDLQRIAPFTVSKINYNINSDLPNILDNPESKAFLSSLEEYPSDLIQLPSGTLITAKLEEQKESFIPNFSELKNKISDKLALIKINELLVNQANIIKDEIIRGIYPSANSSEYTLEQFTDINRSFSSPTISIDVVREIFKIEKKDSKENVAIYSMVNDGIMKLILLEKISELDETNPALSQLISSIEVNLSNQLNNDVFTYFLNSLRDNIKININNNAIENTLSRFE